MSLLQTVFTNYLFTKYAALYRSDFIFPLSPSALILTMKRNRLGQFVSATSYS